MTENEISKEVVDACFIIHTRFGPGLFESVYEELLSYELIKRGLDIKRQEFIRLVHENVVLNKAFKADLVVEDKVIIEIKSVE